jgi:biopolymer transport protein TolR
MKNISIFYRQRNRGSINNINVTPLVDVMLVLLIIFMITSPMLVSGINVDLPKSQAQPIAGQDEPISITVDRFGSTYINDSSIKQNLIVKKLRAITHEKYDTRIFVRGDNLTNYGKIIKVVGLINSAGFLRVALVTEIES